MADTRPDEDWNALTGTEDWNAAGDAEDWNDDAAGADPELGSLIALSLASPALVVGPPSETGAVNASTSAVLLAASVEVSDAEEEPAAASWRPPNPVHIVRRFWPRQAPRR